MGGYYDDNFGHWEGMEPGHPDYEDNVEFARKVRKESRLKKCQGCGAKVRLRPDYAYCNSCADARERGWDCG